MPPSCWETEQRGEHLLHDGHYASAIMTLLLTNLNLHHSLKVVIVSTSQTEILSQRGQLFTQSAVISTFYTSRSDICTQRETVKKCPILEILLSGATSLYCLSWLQLFLKPEGNWRSLENHSVADQKQIRPIWQLFAFEEIPKCHSSFS